MFRRRASAGKTEAAVPDGGEQTRPAGHDGQESRGPQPANPGPGHPGDDSAEPWGPPPAGLVVTLPLAAPDRALRVLLVGRRPRYFLDPGGPGEPLEVSQPEGHLDRAVYLLLADLAARHAAIAPNGPDPSVS